MTTLDLQVNTSAGDSRMQSVANDAGRVSTASGVCSITESVLSPGSHGSGDEWWVAARFTSVTVDQGTTITSATFKMTAQTTYNAGSNVIKYLVAAHAADNAAALAATNGNLNNTTRPQTTAVSSAWTQTSVTADTEYTIDVTSVVQEIINRAGWANGNAIVILVCVDTSTTLNEWQDYYAYDGSTTKAPKLQIVYSSGTTYTETGFAVLGLVSAGGDVETMPDNGAGVVGLVSAGGDVGGGVDGGSSLLGWVANAADVGTFPDSGFAVIGVESSGGDTGGGVDGGAGVAGLIASGADAESMVDSGAAIIGTDSSGGDVGTFPDAGASVTGWIAQGADVAGLIDGGFAVWDNEASGTESQGGTTYTETGFAVWNMSASGAELWVGYSEMPHPVFVRSDGSAVAQSEGQVNQQPGEVAQSPGIARQEPRRVR